MKRIIQKSIIAIATVAFTISSSYKAFALSIADDKTEVRNVAGFHGIKVSSGLGVSITQGDIEKVSVTADASIIAQIKTEVKDGILEIYVEKNGKTENWNSRQHVAVTIKDINSIVVVSGSDVTSTNRLKAEKLFTQTASGSDLTLDVDVKDLISETASGSDTELSGVAKSFNVSSSSGSDVKAFKLIAEVCVAQASSGSDIEITVTKQLTANASSGSDINYKGNPANVTKNEASGGEVASD